MSVDAHSPRACRAGPAGARLDRQRDVLAVPAQAHRVAEVVACQAHMRTSRPGQQYVVILVRNECLSQLELEKKNML